MFMSKAIGGYFGLEIDRENQYHSSLLKLNTARNCLEYILLVKEYKKIYLPYYTCDVLLEPINNLGVEYEFYHIDLNFYPLINKSIASDEAFLYTNYFGLKQDIVLELSKKIDNLIIDNAQAFYAQALNGIDTFYSARKFFGVPEGAYLYTDKYLERELSFMRTDNISEYLVGRLEGGAESYYPSFVESEESLVGKSICRMSILSESILSNIDYFEVKCVRRRNFDFLRNELDEYNKLMLPILSEDDVPLVYPFLFESENLRSYLIEKKIYIPQYWPCVLNWTQFIDFEYQLASYLCPLPIDQRYDLDDMSFIVSIIKNYINKN